MKYYPVTIINHCKDPYNPIRCPVSWQAWFVVSLTCEALWSRMILLQSGTSFGGVETRSHNSAEIGVTCKKPGLVTPSWELNMDNYPKWRHLWKEIQFKTPLLLVSMLDFGGVPSWELTYPLPLVKMMFIFQRWDMLVLWRVPIYLSAAYRGEATP